MRQHKKLPARITTAAAAALVVLPLEHVEMKAARPPGVRVRVAQQSQSAPVAASARAWSFNGENGIFVRNGRVRARVRVLNQPQRDKVHRKKAASIAAAATDALRLYHLDTWRPRVRPS